MELKTVFSLKGLFLCLFLLSFLTSCKKDEKEEECVPPSLSTQLKGATWKADIMALSTSIGKVDLTFTQNGEVKGNLSPYLAMISGGGQIDELIKYEVLNDTSVKIVGTSQGNEIPVALGVQERTCEKIVLVTTGVTITLTK